MKLTRLMIAPRSDWDKNSPIICTVKLSSEAATVETVLSDDQAQQVLALVQGIVAEAAARNVADFVAHVSALQASASVAALTA